MDSIVWKQLTATVCGHCQPIRLGTQTILIAVDDDDKIKLLFIQHNFSRVCCVVKKECFFFCDFYLQCPIGVALYLPFTIGFCVCIRFEWYRMKKKMRNPFRVHSWSNHREFHEMNGTTIWQQYMQYILFVSRPDFIILSVLCASTLSIRFVRNFVLHT